MHRTRVKICGITRPQDAEHAADVGVDAIGLVFYDKSPRCVTPEKAQEICAVLPAFVTTVALFKNETRDNILTILGQTQLDMLQFHGNESAEFCRQFGKPYIKAIGTGEMSSAAIAAKSVSYSDARGLLLDSHAPGDDGGSGESFDWNVIPDAITRPVILAGGLDVNNIADAIRHVNPYAVDLSSGVERIKGEKDAALVTAFMEKMRSIYTS